MGKLSFTLFIPALNEADAMRQIMPRVKREWVDQILVVDGGSSDDTVEYSRSQGFDVYVQKQKGLRYAYKEGWPLIRGEAVVTFSPDGNSIPELIPELIDKMNEGYDMVIASRYLGPAKSYDDNWLTGFGNWFCTQVLVNGLHGSHLTDAMGMYRAYKKQLFYDLDIDKDESYATEKLFFTTIGCEPLISARAAKCRLNVTEIPGDEPRRIGGKAKLRVIQWGGALFTQVIREAWHWKKRRHSAKEGTVPSLTK